MKLKSNIFKSKSKFECYKSILKNQYNKKMIFYNIFYYIYMIIIIIMNIKNGYPIIVYLLIFTITFHFLFMFVFNPICLYRLKYFDES